MNKIFCPECGKANIYSFTKPQNCRFCNSLFSFASESTKSQAKKQPPQFRIVVEEEDENFDFSGLTSKDLVEIEDDKSLGSRHFKFEQVLNPNSNIDVSTRSSTPRKFQDVNEVLRSNAKKEKIDFGDE